MTGGGKLGQLVIGGQSRRNATGRQRRQMAFVIGTFLVMLAAVLAAWFWISSPVRKVVVRGSTLMPASELLALMEIDGSDSLLTGWRKTRKYDGTGSRWVKGAGCRPLFGRSLLIEVHERKPLLRLVCGNSKYWLCEHGWLADMDVIEDQGGIFDRIRQLPSIETAVVDANDRLPGADNILEVAAACLETMPGEIELIEVSPNGELVIYDTEGFPIKLGQPVMLAEKIGALPKALRVCEENRDKLLYLDASNPSVFYEKWKEPQGEAGT